MPVRPPDRNARVSARTDGEALEVSLAGTWKITDARPGWAALRGAQTPSRVRLRIEEVDAWDSSLLLFLFEVRQWCAATGAECDLTALPERLRTLLAQLSASHASSVPRDRGRNLFAEVGDASLDVWRKGRDILEFVGECVLGIARAVQRPMPRRAENWLPPRKKPPTWTRRKPSRPRKWTSAWWRRSASR